jgi:cytidine deaminase
MEIKDLLEKAKKAAEKSYSPYSNFRVGSSVLTTEGKIFTGTNIENKSYGGTICAERVAVSKAISEGYKKIEVICIVGLDSPEILPPCGICRQFIAEFGREIKIIMANKNLEYKIVLLNELLPYDSLFNLKNK